MMNTDEWLVQYQQGLEIWKRGQDSGFDKSRPEPDPKDFNLTTAMDLWAAKRIRKEVLG